jgi:hypothetical protein
MILKSGHRFSEKDHAQTKNSADDESKKIILLYGPSED